MKNMKKTVIFILKYKKTQKSSFSYNFSKMSAYYSEPYDIKHPISSPPPLSNENPRFFSESLQYFSPIKTVITYEKPLPLEENPFKYPYNAIHGDQVLESPKKSEFKQNHENILQYPYYERPFAGLQNEYKPEEKRKEIELDRLERSCDEMARDVDFLKKSLCDRLKLEEGITQRNRELEAELNILKKSRYSPPKAYKIEEIIEFRPAITQIPVFEPIEKHEEKVKKAKIPNNDEVLRLKTEIEILKDELDKERKEKKNNGADRDLYKKLCQLSEDLKNDKEIAKELENDLNNYRDQHKNRKLKRMQFLNDMIERLKHAGIDRNDVVIKEKKGIFC